MLSAERGRPLVKDYLEERDYPIISKWWEAQKFPVVPMHLLPVTGYIANECAAGFLYLTNSPISWIEWVVGDPKAEKQLRSESLDELISYMIEKARFIGTREIFTSAVSFPFIQRLKKHGFREGDVKTSHFFRSI